jgi:hypothetical protein
MPETTYSTLGKVTFFWHKNEENESDQTAKIFLKKLIKNYCNENYEYHESVGDFAFMYGERCAMTHIIASVRNLTTDLLAELPYKTKLDKDESENKEKQRFIDLWCRYENIEYFIEVKHGFNNSKTPDLTSDVLNLYKKSLEQIKVFEAEQLDKKFGKIASNRYKIALMIMPNWVGSTKPEEPKKEFISEGYEKELWENLYEKVNFAGMCRLNGDIEAIEIETGNEYRKYPLLTLFGWIEKID